LTCDNRPNMAPICSTRPGTGAISTLLATPGTNLCTGGNPNLCAMCAPNAAAATCGAGQTVVCSNYHSSSLILPAPVCATTAQLPAATIALALPIAAEVLCTNGVPQCPEIAAPSCTAANGNAQCTGAFGGADDRGVLSCTGIAPGQPPVCSVEPGAVRLDGTGGCTNNIINFVCGDFTLPFCPAATSAQNLQCPAGFIKTCDGRAGGQSPICTRDTTATAVNPAAACVGGAVPNC